jgi:hypothetical protein
MIATALEIGTIVRDSSGNDWRIVGLDFEGKPRQKGPLVVLEPLIRTRRGEQHNHMTLVELEKYSVVGRER